MFVFLQLLIRAFLAPAVFLFDRRHRHVVLRNLRIAMPELTSEERHDLAVQSFEQFFVNLLTHLVKIDLNNVEIVGQERLEECKREGRGAVLLLSHYGTWELLSRVASKFRGYEMYAVYQPLRNRWLDRLLGKFRSRGGVRLLDRNRQLMEAAHALKRGGFVGVFVDQHAGDHGKWVPFFNKLASTSVLPVVLQGHSNAAMIPVYCEAKTEGGWRVEFGPEIASCRDEGETLHRIHLALEKKILENPALYFWLHNRWKVPKRHIFFYHYRRGFYWPPGHDLQRFRILVRCTNWLGDAVLTIPALRAIKIARPDCHVTLMAPPDLLEFWKGQYYLDAVVPPEELQDSEFDLGIVFPNSMRAFLELYQNEVDTIVGYAGDFPRRFMLDVVVPDRCRAGFREHDVYDFLGLVDYLGAGTAKQVPEYTISKTLGKDEKTIAMHMGASYGPAKRWGEERFVELAKRFPDYRWVLIGAPDEDDVNRQAATQIGRNAIVARTKLDELGKLLARSRCLVCNDSGPMHFAAAVGTPVVAVFGSTEPSLTGPLGEGHEIVREKVECSPCFLRECPIDLRCMNGVSVDAVERALRRVLSRTSSVGKN